MKTIGVLGGIGPQATMDFEARVHSISQQRIPQHDNSGYPPMIVYYHRSPPMRLDEHSSPLVPLQLDTRLLEAAKKLGSTADFLVVPCNSAHQFQHELEQTSGLKVLSMIDLAVNEVRRRGWQY